MSAQYSYEPFFSFADFHRLFEDSLTGENQLTQKSSQDTSPLKNRGAFPKVDIHESKDSNVVTASFELPGLKKEDVNIDIHNCRLTVSGQTLLSKDIEKDDYIVHERRWGKFSRSIPLPAGTSAEQIIASMEHGLLTVTFPKTSPEQQAKKITIA